MSNLNISVRSLMIPMVSDTLLLPNASLAEIVTYNPPEAVKDSPDWCMGMLHWRGLEVPLVSFEGIQNAGASEVSKKSRIAVFNSLGGNGKLPFFAVVVQGIPHLLQANQSVVTALAEDAGDESAVLAHVLVEAEPAVIPDLDLIESMILEEPSICSCL